MATRQDPPLTAGEYAKIAYYSARILKRGIAGETVYVADLEAKITRIVDRAKRRADQQ
jgi:hypothetical protein